MSDNILRDLKLIADAARIRDGNENPFTADVAERAVAEIERLREHQHQRNCEFINAAAELEAERDRYKREIEAAGNGDFDWSVLARLDRLEELEAENERLRRVAEQRFREDCQKGAGT